MCLLVETMHTKKPALTLWQECQSLILLSQTNLTFDPLEGRAQREEGNTDNTENFHWIILMLKKS